MKQLTEFQVECERELLAALAERSLTLVNRRTGGKNETYICAEIAGKELRLWIYEDEAMFKAGGKDYAYEAPDYQDKGLLISSFVAAIIVCLENWSPPDSGSSRISLFKGKEL